MTADEQWAYEEVEAGVVPAEVKQVAEATLVYCCRDLGLPPVRIIWFRRTEPCFARMEQLFERLSRLALDYDFAAQGFFDVPLSAQVRGRFDDRMWVRCDQCLDAVVRSVAHEAMHLADQRKYRPALTKVEQDVWEQRAAAYELRIAGETLLALGVGGGAHAC